VDKIAINIDFEKLIQVLKDKNPQTWLETVLVIDDWLYPNSDIMHYEESSSIAHLLIEMNVPIPKNRR